jgi:hypothetical protein
MAKNVQLLIFSINVIYKMQKYKNEKSFWLLCFTVGLQVRLFGVLENYGYHKPELNMKLEGATWIC